LLSSNKINVKELDLKEFCTEKVFEVYGGIWSPVNTSSNVCVLVIYRSPNQNFHDFCQKLSDVLEAVFKPFLSLVLCGDFNVDPVMDEGQYRELLNV